MSGGEQTGLTYHPEETDRVPARPQHRRARLRVSGDFDAELEADGEEDKRDGSDEDEDDEDASEVVGAH